MLFDVPPLHAQTRNSIYQASSGEKAAVYGGIAAAAGIVVLVTYLVLHKPSITGCTQQDTKGLALRTEGHNAKCSLTGDTGQLKAGEHVRLSGKANKKHHTFAVSKVSKYFCTCPASAPLH